MKQLYLTICSILIHFTIGQCCKAATNTTTFNVTASVTANCSVAANNLSFGNYNPLGPATQSTTDLTITCTNGSAYNVGLNGGTTAGADVNNRMMANGANTLSYGLFQDAARTINWGNTVGSDTVSGIGTGIAQVITIYGKIASAQYVPPGAYSDTITLTATF